MKINKIGLCIFVLVLITVFSVGCSRNEADPWKEWTEYEYYPDGTVFKEYNYEGYKTKEENGVLNQDYYLTYVREYYENGNLKIESEYNGDIVSNLTEYDINKNVIKELHNDWDGSFMYCCTYKYNEAGLIVEECEYSDKEDVLSSQTLYEYHANGNLYKSVQKEYADSVCTKEVIVENDENGKWLKTKTYDSEKRLIELVYQEKESTLRINYYNEDGTLREYKIEEYKNEEFRGIIKETIYSSEGKMKSVKDYADDKCRLYVYAEFGLSYVYEAESWEYNGGVKLTKYKPDGSVYKEYVSTGDKKYFRFFEEYDNWVVLSEKDSNDEWIIINNFCQDGSFFTQEYPENTEKWTYYNPDCTMEYYQIIVTNSDGSSKRTIYNPDGTIRSEFFE